MEEEMVKKKIPSADFLDAGRVASGRAGKERYA
jgi:hypothetical protein